jgi:DNA-binding NarL/FixJ family response regulator
MADDHSFYRTQLRTLLESIPNWQVCAEAVTGIEAVEMHSYFEPDITVMDFNMPGMSRLLRCSAFLAGERRSSRSVHQFKSLERISLVAVRAR